MALNPVYLADKSALARMKQATVRQRLEPLLVDGLVATCGIIDLEIGYSTRNAPVHRDVRHERRALPRAPLDDVFDRAFDVQAQLAERGQHRLPIPDLVIAAAAERAGLTVLHYDADFERIAGVTGQAHEWVATPAQCPEPDRGRPRERKLVRPIRGPRASEGPLAQPLERPCGRRKIPL